MIKEISLPTQSFNQDFNLGDQVVFSGKIFTARDAVLPKLANLYKEKRLSELNLNFIGSAIMHTAFSPAGYGPTSSNKEEIEGTMGILSEAGVKFHLGKGAISQKTVSELMKFDSYYVVVPPTTALLLKRLISKKVVAFEEEGMEALHELIVDKVPGVIAAAKGESIFDKIRKNNL